MAEPAPDSPEPLNLPAAGSAGPTISTHVLDASTGQPAVGIHVTLHRIGDDGRPVRLTQALTDGDGRVRDLLDRPLAAGIYRLEFNLAGSRGAGSGDDRFFQRVTLEIRVADVARSYHVPLLMAPFSLTTYRGS